MEMADRMRRLLEIPRILVYLWRSSPHLTLIWLTLTLIAGLAPAAHLWLGKLVVDRLVLVTQGGPHQLRLVAPWVLLWITIGVSVRILWRSNRLVEDHLRTRAELYLQGALLERSASVPLERLEDSEFHNQLQRAGTVVKGRLVTMLRRFVTTSETTVQIIGLLLAIALRSWVLVPVLLGGTAIVAIFKVRAVASRTQVYRSQAAAERKVRYLEGLLSDVGASKEIRLLHTGEYLLSAWQRERDALWAARLTAERRIFLNSLGADAVNVALYLLALAYLTFMMAGNRSTVGDYVVMMGAVMQLQNGLQTLVRSLLALQEETLYTADLFDLLDRSEAEKPGGHSLPVGLDQGIRLEEVSFTYPGVSRPAVSGLSLHIRPGERLAIVGPNGSGKTTFVKLILGLYPPSSGSISWSGVPDTSLDRIALRRYCSAVFQNFVRYELSVQENIGLGDVERIHDAKVVARASSMGGADEVIALSPHGYKTRLGKSFGGVDLSGGQWQKLAISRALMRHDSSQLLVLDEPTSGLDPMAEADVFARFATLSSGKTALLISHRLGSARLADRIVYLEDGQVVEVGSHAELMTLGGRYAQLFATQAQWYM